MHKLHGGGISRAIRRICVISAALAEPPADTKCQFGGSLPHIRLPLRREYCNFRRICCICRNFCIEVILSVTASIIRASTTSPSAMSAVIAATVIIRGAGATRIIAA